MAALGDSGTGHGIARSLALYRLAGEKVRFWLTVWVIAAPSSNGFVDRCGDSAGRLWFKLCQFVCDVLPEMAIARQERMERAPEEQIVRR